MKLKKVGRNLLLAICDTDILGKTLHDGRIVFQVKEDFYKGAKVNIDEAIYMIENCTIVNMVGKNIVGRAIEKGYVHPEAVLVIARARSSAFTLTHFCSVRLNHF